MIKLIRQGHYVLIETHKGTKIIQFDKKLTFAWIVAGSIGEILVASHREHRVDHVLAIGKYRLYDIEREPQITDLVHLELYVGEEAWQGYLLPKGMPTKENRRHRIIPTSEIITRTTTLQDLI